MNYLLDTCAISELVKKKPSKKVLEWILGCDESCIFLSVLTLGEIQKGIAKLADSRFNLAVRPRCDPAVFRDICYDSLEKAKMELDKTGINIPSPQ